MPRCAVSRWRAPWLRVRDPLRLAHLSSKIDYRGDHFDAAGGSIVGLELRDSVGSESRNSPYLVEEFNPGECRDSNPGQLRSLIRSEDLAVVTLY